MADLLTDGMTRVQWVTTLSSVTSPTATQLNAGTAISSFITPDGLDITPSTASVDLGALDSTFDASGPGRRKYDITLTIKRQTGTDTLFETTLTYQAAGFLVVRRNVTAATSFSAGQKVEVYPVTCGEPGPVKPAPNEVAKYTVPMFNTSDASRVSTVA